jgi:hypothetical protein
MGSTQFNEEQFQAIYPPGIENHYWTLGRNLIIARILRKHGLANKKILEIGCGRGIVVEFLRQRGFDCSGVELAPITIPKEIKSYVWSGLDYVHLAPEFAQTVEVAMLLDIIEHVADDVDFVQRVKNSFPNLKYLLITVPARQELWSNYDEFNGHFRRYDVVDLGEVIKKAGLIVRSCSYLFHTLYVSARLLLSSRKKRNTRIKAPLGFMKYVHRFLAFMFVAESVVVSGSVRGTSIICIAGYE